MNTGKQVNAMIGLLFLTVLILGAYFVNEGSRQVEAEEHITERNAERGARLFVANCRTCHGLEGKGPEEGGFGPVLNTNAFLILGEDNEFGAAPTPQGEADGIRKFLRDTITCGRTGTFMPSWAQRFGGSLSDTQIDHIVIMITEGRWDLVAEEGHHVDEETGATAKDIIITDPSALSVTQSNCGQYSGDAAQAFRSRDPFAPPGATPPPKPAGTPPPSAPPATGDAVAVSLSEFAVKLSGGDSAPAGGVSFRASNDGQIAHELVVIKSDLAPDALPVAGGVVAESQVEVVGRIAQWPGGGQVREGTFEMPAGQYVLICNLPAHYQGGMRAAFTAE